MKLAPQSCEILRQYKALINARRRDAGQRELTTAQVMDEICYYMTCQCAVYIGGHFILQGGKRAVSMMAGGPARRAPVSPRENPGRLRLPERNFAAPPAPRTFLSVVSRS
ncbi:AreA [Salmonella enterica subsp. arizonae]|uniref:AreA n=1 Tax=Salmonella enterica subsp. arizonae TaxID=59203 RepID=A0A379T5X9_SALER|nr:AreA [Salmonella enterica subsp. arizonae]